MILPVYIKTFLYNPFKLKFTQLLILCSHLNSIFPNQNSMYTFIQILKKNNLITITQIISKLGDN